jgi:hypothetical protein
LDSPAHLLQLAKENPSQNAYQDVSWYNPDNDSLVGIEELIDYAPVLLPSSSNCRDPGSLDDPQVKTLAGKLHEVYGPDSVCAMSTIFNGAIGEVVLNALPACFRGRCGTDGKLRMTLDDDREQVCTRDGRKLYSKKHIGHVKCPTAREACATHSKFPTLDILTASPDRGPHDGQNCILFTGTNLLRYNETGDFALSIGPFSLEIIEYENSRILAQLPKLDVALTKDLIMQPQALIAKLPPSFADVISPSIPDFYTFTSRMYSAGNGFASPAVILFVLGVVACFI